MLVFLLGIIVLVLDQLTKQAVRAHLVYNQKIPVIDGFFNLVYVRNDGAAWNILSGHSIILILISLAVLVALFVYRKRFLQDGLLHKVLLGLLVGGIAGNLVDRIRFGWVTDFLDFEFGTYHYPSFNVARLRDLYCHRALCDDQCSSGAGKKRKAEGGVSVDG